jgi:hypothetical protein
MTETRCNKFRVGDVLKLREFATGTRTRWSLSHNVPVGAVVTVQEIRNRSNELRTDGITFVYKGETMRNVDELWFDRVPGFCGRCEGETYFGDYLCESCRNHLTNLT